MKCQKCFLEFPEGEIELSHDIPKWISGTDKEGRHYLCKECHRKYEDEILRITLMNFFNKLPNKKDFKWCAKLVREFYFKKEGGEGVV